jgi:site-specific recombinase XerD
VNSVKLFFREIEGSELNVDLVHRPKREKLLPHVLSMDEVKEVLEHKSSKTSEIYTPVCTKSIQKIKSPFDNFLKNANIDKYKTARD